MKIKRNGWIIETKSLFQVKWNKYYPVFIIHEKYQKKIKWILRILTFIGITTSIITMPWYLGLSVSIVLILLELLLEKVIFLYTTIVVQNFPKGFKIEGEKWLTNGFAIPRNKEPDLLPFIGPAFDSKEYAEKFFKYICSWNNVDKIDTENKIVLSFVIEPNNTYTTFIYANPQRKNLEEIFENEKEKMKYEKYGKQPQQLFMQVFLAQNFAYGPEYQIAKFLETYSTNDHYFLCPFILHQDESTEFLSDLRILKFSYKIKNREELIKTDVEYDIK